MADGARTAPIPLGSGGVMRKGLGTLLLLRGVALLCIAGGVVALGVTERREGNGKI